MRPQDTSLEEGKPGYLHCQAKASPEPEVTWFRNNLMITPEVTHTKHAIQLPNFTKFLLYACVQDLNSIKMTTNVCVCVCVCPRQDARFKSFRNGTLRFKNVEVYDGQMYSCEARTLAGRLSGHARVSVLGEQRGSLGSSVKQTGFLSSGQIRIQGDERKHQSDAFHLPV